MRAPSFWREEGLLPRALLPLSCLYGWASQRARARILPTRAAVPVLCVGNVASGGQGKTPVALDLLQRLARRGLRPQALTRGYGGRAAGPLRVRPDQHDAREVGDEALLLAAVAPTWVARDRVAGAEAAVAAGAGCLVMDDGLQNPTLAKDLSLIVIDGRFGFGNGHLLPAGPLRERPEEAFARAEAVVLLGEDERGVLQHLPPHLRRLEGRLAPVGPRLPEGHPFLAFAGIGRPEKFFDTLASHGAILAETRAFADHHRYRPAELAALAARAEALSARLITTEKDAVRLPGEFRSRVAVLRVGVVWQDSAAVEGLLDRLERHDEAT